MALPDTPKTLDVWMRRSDENAHKLQQALSDFGLEISDSDVNQMLTERKFLRFGHEPTRIEILNFLDGCEFELASTRACHETLGSVSVAILCLEDYVATKRASGRPKDASDLALLRSMIRLLPGDPADSEEL